MFQCFTGLSLIWTTASLSALHPLIGNNSKSRIQSRAICQQSKHFSRRISYNKSFLSWRRWHSLQVRCVWLTSFKHMSSFTVWMEAVWFESLCCFASLQTWVIKATKHKVHACSTCWRPLHTEDIKDTTWSEALFDRASISWGAAQMSRSKR